MSATNDKYDAILESINQVEDVDEGDGLSEAKWGDVGRMVSGVVSRATKRLAYVAKELPGVASEISQKSAEGGRHPKAAMGPQATSEQELVGLMQKTARLLADATDMAYDALVAMRYIGNGKMKMAEAMLKKHRR